MITIPINEMPKWFRTENKAKPDYYVFLKNAEGNNQLVGAAFAHKKGKGLNIMINDQRFAAFPPNPNARLNAEASHHETTV